MFLFVNHFNNCADEHREFVCRNRECRREIDDITDWPYKHTQFNEPRAHCVEIVDPVQLDNSDRALHANVPHAPNTAAWREPLGKRSGNSGDLL